MRATAIATRDGGRSSPSALRWMNRPTAGKSSALAARMAACISVSITPGLTLTARSGQAWADCSIATERTKFSSPALAAQYSDHPA